MSIKSHFIHLVKSPADAIPNSFLILSNPHLSTNPSCHLLLQSKCRVFSHKFPQLSSPLPPKICSFNLKRKISIALILVSPFYASFHTWLHQLSFIPVFSILSSRKEERKGRREGRKEEKKGRKESKKEGC